MFSMRIAHLVAVLSYGIIRNAKWRVKIAVISRPLHGRNKPNFSPDLQPPVWGVRLAKREKTWIEMAIRTVV
jgi:hypothetical protein